MNAPFKNSPTPRSSSRAANAGGAGSPPPVSPATHSINFNELSPAGKRALVLPLIADGLTYAEVAERVGAHSRKVISGIVSRARAAGIQVVSNAANRERKRQKAQGKPKPAKKTAKPQRESKKPAVTYATVEEFIAANGVRRFAPNIRTDFHSIRAYLEERGFTVRCIHRRYLLSRGRGRPRSMTFAGLIAFTDEVRVSEGEQPFKRRAA